MRKHNILMLILIFLLIASWSVAWENMGGGHYQAPFVSNLPVSAKVGTIATITTGSDAGLQLTYTLAGWVTNSNVVLNSAATNSLIITEVLGPELIVDGSFSTTLTNYTVSTANVNTVTKEITMPSGSWTVGEGVQYFSNAGTAITNMTTSATYYIRSVAGLVTTLTTTIGGVPVNITGTGNNNQYFIKTPFVAGPANTYGQTGGSASGFQFLNGYAEKTANGTSWMTPAVPISVQPGHLYKITYSIGGIAGSGLGGSARIGGTSLDNTFNVHNGFQTIYLVASDTTPFAFKPYATAARFTIDNVSVKEVLSGIRSATGAVTIVSNLTDSVSDEYGVNIIVSNNSTSGGAKGSVRIDSYSNGNADGYLPLEINHNGSNIFSLDSSGNITANATLNIVGIITNSYRSGNYYLYGSGSSFDKQMGLISTSQTLPFRSGITTPIGNGGVSFDFDAYTATTGTWGSDSVRLQTVQTTTGSGQGNLLVLSVGTSTQNQVNKFAVNDKGAQIVTLMTAPSSSSDTGVSGEVRYVDGFLYVCRAANSWIRTALTSW